MSLLDRKILVITGKGGVGRTTVAATLARAAAAEGKRVCVVELSGLDEVAGLFEVEPGTYAPQELDTDVFHRTLTPEDCVDDFGRRKLKVNALVRLVFRSRIMRSFLEAVPGLHDLVQLGKIENMINEPLPGEPHWDLVILDAPATGHGLTLLGSARSMREMTGVGPFAELARIIEVFLSDAAQTGIVLVTLPEELPVNETLDLLAALREDHPAEQDTVAMVVANQVRPPPLPSDLGSAWASARPAVPSDVAHLVDQAIARDLRQREALARLRRGTGAVPVIELPRGDLDALAEAAHSALEST